MVAFWIALAVFLACVVGGLVYTVLRGLTAWRQVKRTGRTFTAETARIAAKTEEMETHLDRANTSAARLQEATGQLGNSRARLDIQLKALREAREAVRRTFWFLPI